MVLENVGFLQLFDMVDAQEDFTKS